MRAILVAVLATFGIAIVAIQALSVPLVGDLPDFGIRQLDASRRVVSWVSPEAAQAGLRAGDHYDWASATAEQRAARFREIPAGGALELPVVRNGKPSPVRLVARPRTARDHLASYADVVFKMLAMAVGLVLVARGRGRFGLFAGVGLFGVAAREGFGVSYAILGWPLQLVARYWFFAIGSSLGYLRFEAMIALCGSSLKRPEVWFFRAAGVAVTAAVVAASVDFAHAALTSSGTHVSNAFFLGAQGLSIVYLLGYGIALLRPRMRDRELLVWVFWTSLVGSSGSIVNVTLAILGHPIPAYGALNLTLFVTAFGYAYVALRYRVVDLSFVVNRAVVYATILALVVTIFTIAEMVITKFALSKANGIAIEICVSLAVAFSVKPVERWIDAIVERALFARKHATEEGLRALIHDCSHVEEAERLLQNVCEEARRLIGAEHVIAYERFGEVVIPAAASPAQETLLPISIDDPVVVRMRSSLAPVELGGLRSSFGTAGTVFPMLSRGRMLGALACGDKPGRRAYDPDERRLFAELAHEMGTSLLFLRTASVPSTSNAAFGARSS